jgi:hypothetical protein
MANARFTTVIQAISHPDASSLLPRSEDQAELMSSGARTSGLFMFQTSSHGCQARQDRYSALIAQSRPIGNGIRRAATPPTVTVTHNLRSPNAQPLHSHL